MKAIFDDKGSGPGGGDRMRAASKAPTPVLTAKALRKGYHSGDREIEVLREAEITVAAGESVSIRGESGSGKTTLLNLLAGLDGPEAGEIRWEGAAVTGVSPAALTRLRARFAGLVFQAYYLIPELDALANVLMARRVMGPVRAADRSRAQELLARMGLADRARHLPTQLSGGECQRVAIGRALMNRPRIILADEPTGNLDEHTGDTVVDLLLGACREQGAALVLVTHNPRHAARCDRQVLLHEGILRPM